MALPHAQSGQIVSVRPLGARLADTVTTAILKAGQLEVMRVVLPVGKSMKEHQTPGEATVQCIEGVVAFSSEQGIQQPAWQRQYHHRQDGQQHHGDSCIGLGQYTPVHNLPLRLT